MKIILIILFFSLNIFIVYSQSEDAKDSVIKLSGVTIEAESGEQQVQRYQPVYIIDKAYIENKGIWQISELINSAPGLHIKDYGGLGSIKTVSIRGSASGNTLVALDGFKLNSSQTGTLDISIIPATLVNSIEIVRGGNSPKFGSNASSGLLNIRTDRRKENSLNLNLSAGSFSSYSMGAQASYGSASDWFSAFADYQYSQGDFPFELQQFGDKFQTNRINAEYNSFNSSFAYESIKSDFHSISRIIISDTDKGVPEAVINGIGNSTTASINEFNSILYSRNRWTLTDNPDYYDSIPQNKSSYYIESMVSFNKMTYQESEFSAFFGRINEYNQFQSLMKSGLLIRKNNVSIEGYIEFDYSQLIGDILQPDIGRFINRFIGAAAAEFNVEFIRNTSYSSYFESIARIDVSNEQSPTFSFTANSGVQWAQLELFAGLGFSKNFRYPSFNEMYYLNYGNSALLPERSYDFSGFIRKSVADKSFIELAVFYSKTNDKIISIPKSPVSWTAKNVGNTDSYGLEFSSMLCIKQPEISLISNYTIQNTIDKTISSPYFNQTLPYVPRELASINLMMELWIIDATITCNYTGFRFFLPDNLYSSLLPENIVFDFNLHTKLDVGLELDFILSINNAFDYQYQVVRNYPMPGRNFKLTTKCRIK